MAWVRLDDQVAGHPKILRAGPEAAWVWVCGIAYCSRHLTDGNIPAEALRTFGVSGVERLAKRLVEVGLWEADGDDFRVHDYHEHNPSAASVKTQRRAAVNRVTKWKEKRVNNAVSNAVTNAVTKRASPGPLLMPPGNAYPDGDVERGGNAPPTPTPTPNTPHSPPRGGIALRPSQLRSRAEHIRNKAWGRCHHEPRCETYEACVALIVEGLRAEQVAGGAASGDPEEPAA